MAFTPPPLESDEGLAPGWQPPDILPGNADRAFVPPPLESDQGVPGQRSLLDAMRTPSPAWMQPFETAVKANVQPFIEHPFRSAYEMIVPQPSDIEAFKPSNLARTTPVGSQEYLNQVVGYGLPLLGMGAAEMFPGRAAIPQTAAEAIRAEPTRPVAVPEVPPVDVDMVNAPARGATGRP